MSDQEFTPDPGAVEAPPVAEPAAPEEQPFTVDRNEWEAMRTFTERAGPVISYLANSIQQQQQAQPQPQFAPQEEQAPFDPWEPSTVQNYIRQQVEQGVQEAMGYAYEPYAPLLETVAAQQGEAQAREYLDSLNEQVGSFDQDAALILAASLMSQGTAQPDQALSVAAQYLHGMETTIREDERRRVLEEIKGIQGAPDQHPVAGGPLVGEMETVPTGPDRYRVAVQRALDRRNSTGLPVG